MQAEGTGQQLEQAIFLSGAAENVQIQRYDRIYFGHETCGRRLPAMQQAEAILNVIVQHGKGASLVAPPLAEDQLETTLALVERLAAICPHLEVVCGDWGLLNVLCQQEIGHPVVGRLLMRQQTDPRIATILNSNSKPTGLRALHLDGSLAAVVHRRTPEELARLLQGFVDTEHLYPQGYKGPKRFELSMVPQGIHFGSGEGGPYSLHVGRTPLALMRSCPAEGEDYLRKRQCSSCSEEPVAYRCKGFAVPIFRVGNCMYSRVESLPGGLACHKGIDRMVHWP